MIMTTMISLGIAYRVTILECSVNLPGQLVADIAAH